MSEQPDNHPPFPGSTIADKIIANAITAAQIAAGPNTAAPIGIPEVDVLPDPKTHTGPKIVFNTVDGQLYSCIDGHWELTIKYSHSPSKRAADLDRVWDNLSQSDKDRIDAVLIRGLRKVATAGY